MPPRPILEFEHSSAVKDVPPVYNISGLDQPIDKQLNRAINARFDEDDRLIVSIWDRYATLKDRSVLIEVGRSVTSKEFELYEDPAFGCSVVIEDPNKWTGLKDVRLVYELVERIFSKFYTAVLNSDNNKQALIMKIDPRPSSTKKSEMAMGREKGNVWEIAPDVIADDGELIASEQLRDLYLK